MPYSYLIFIQCYFSIDFCVVGVEIIPPNRGSTRNVDKVVLIDCHCFLFCILHVSWELNEWSHILVRTWRHARYLRAERDSLLISQPCSWGIQFSH